MRRSDIVRKRIAVKQATPKKLPPYIAKSKAAIAAPRVRLLAKHEVMAIANVSYPTIWLWMRDGKFPRSRIVGGKSMWLSSDIDAWLAGLQVRPLKGDVPST
jgi:predicted DNA-binding transcriptional regulator AlpA